MQYVDASKRRGPAAAGAQRYCASAGSGGAGREPQVGCTGRVLPARSFFFSLQEFYSPTRTKAAVVDSQDKIIVVGFFFPCISVSLRNIFFSRKSVLLPSTPNVRRESVLKATAEIADRPFPS